MEDRKKERGYFDSFDVFGDIPKHWETWEELKRFFRTTWNVSDFSLKALYFLVLGWPILLAYVCAMGGGTKITSSLALIPFVAFALVLGISLAADAVILTDPTGRKIFKWIMAIIGVELVIGVYLTAVPLYNDPDLVPMLVLVLAAILVISLSGKLKRIRTLLWITLIVLTIIFVKGGREKVLSDHPDVPEKTQYNQNQGSYGYELKEGYLVEKPSIPTQPLVAAETFKKISSGGSYIEIETNCADFLHNIAPVNPGEKIKIMHINMDPGVRRNRCTYNIAGDAAPISGSAPGEETLPWYKENLPYPDLPAYALVFILTDSSGNIIARDYIKGNGQFIIFQNTGDDEAIVHADYNYPKQFLNQVGRLGDTVTVSFAVYN